MLDWHGILHFTRTIVQIVTTVNFNIIVTGDFKTTETWTAPLSNIQDWISDVNFSGSIFTLFFGFCESEIAIFRIFVSKIWLQKSVDRLTGIKNRVSLNKFENIWKNKKLYHSIKSNQILMLFM